MTTSPGAQPTLAAALESVAKVERLLVVSDFDGALSEFAVNPQDAVPAPGAMAALRRLARLPDTVVAIASGRDVRTLRELSEVGSAEPIVLIGSHGAESTRPEVATTGRLDEQQRTLLDHLTETVAELIERHRGARLERKRAAVAVHTRGLPPGDAEAALSEAVEIGAERDDVRVLTGKSVVELSVSHADKGTAVSSLADVVGADATFYSGDDVTDEDAFRVLAADPANVSVKVGRGSTAAGYRVDSVSDLVQALQDLARRRAEATGQDG